jgi:diguanylate cyclase (GGDEF)-like protein
MRYAVAHLFQFGLRLKNLDSVQQVRVWVTLSSLLLGVVACLSSWLLVRHLPTVALSDLYGLPVVAIGFLLAAALLFLNLERLEAVQFFACVVAGLFLLFDFRFSGLPSLERENMLGVGVLWFPVIVVIAHLTLAARPALYISIGYNTLAILISIFTFQGIELQPVKLNALMQFHAANLVLTGFIAVFGQMRQRFHSVQQQAHTDVLTGIQNRRFMQQHLEQVHASGQMYALLLLDVDFFKQLNDRYGHAFGDVVLRELAFALESHTRQGDHVARWGGEEFLVLAKNMNLEQARFFAERLRKAVLDANPGGARVTVSIGVALRGSEDGLEHVLARADAALYRAKKSGRDQVRSTVVT